LSRRLKTTITTIKTTAILSHVTPIQNSAKMHSRDPISKNEAKTTQLRIVTRNIFLISVTQTKYLYHMMQFQTHYSGADYKMDCATDLQ